MTLSCRKTGPLDDCGKTVPYFRKQVIESLTCIRRYPGRIPGEVSFCCEDQIRIAQRNVRNTVFINQHHTQVGERRTLKSPTYPNFFNRILCFSESGCIEKRHRQTLNVHPHFDHITRGSRDVRRNCSVTPRQCVQKTGFPHVGCPKNSDFETSPNTFRGVHTVNFPTNRTDHGGDPRKNVSGHIDRNLLISEIYGGFKKSGRFDQHAPPTFDPLSESPRENAQGLDSLAFGFSFDQIGQGFNLGQVQAIIFQRPTREFTGLCHTQPRDPFQHAQDSPLNRDAAMQMKLGDSLTRETGTLIEYQNQGFIEDFAVGIAKLSKRRLPWLGDHADQQANSFPRKRSGYADHRDPGLSGRACQSEDGVQTCLQAALSCSSNRKIQSSSWSA